MNTILRWDSLLNKQSTFPIPVIYFKPSLADLSYFKRNNYNIKCKVSGTNSSYDNYILTGVALPSTGIAGCRPNFFEETGYWCIQLNIHWNGYPERLGYFELN